MIDSGEKQMFAVTVSFNIRKGKAAEFLNAMKLQARNSLRLETGCHHFDVCVDENDEHRIFLYELYTNRAAFDLHMESAHYRAFSDQVAPWVEDKEVRFWKLKDIGQ